MPRLSPAASLLAIALAVAPLGAQDTSTAITASPTDSVAAAAPAPVAGPTVMGASVAAHTPRAEFKPSDAAARAAAPRTHHGQSAALMIVGGAAVVLGLIVGGDAQTPLVVGGAVVGLIGLYQYLL